MVYFSLFSPIRSILFSSVHLIHFSLFWSIRSTLINPCMFGSLWSILSNLDHSIHFGLFNSIWPTRPLISIRTNLVYSIYLVYFRSLWSNSVYLLKNGKIQVWIESITNYLRNISCNYMISFCYLNNVLKKLRIWIINLKLKKI